MNHQGKRMSKLTNKVIALLTVLIAVSTATVGIICYTIYRSSSIDARGFAVEHIAVSLARRIDGDQFAEIMDSLEANDYWHEIKDYADFLAAEYETEYLYILDDQITASNEVIYFAEGTLGDEPYDLGAPDDASVYAPEMMESVRTGKSLRTKPYESGDYGTMISGFAPIIDSSGKVVGVVGADFTLNAIVAETYVFAFYVIIAIIAVILLSCVLMYFMGNKYVGKPLVLLDNAAKQMSVGNTEIHLNINDNTEIGRLADSFNDMIDGINKQIHVLEALSGGDLTINIEMRSEADAMSRAMQKMVDSLNTTFSDINDVSIDVANSAKEIAEGSLSLAQGATEQTAAVAMLSTSISKVAEKTMESANMAVEAAQLGNTIKINAEKGTQQMEQMMDAVKQINEASQSISKVISVIDSIAFQTNILALNAAVEAARAGQHGKGFAVVAEEVRSLASKSAEAAKDTGALIENSMEKAALGARIAEATSASLEEIVLGINENSRIVKVIAESSENQTNAIKEINSGITQVGEVVHLISKGAELSSGASFSMKDESGALSAYISNYNLKDKGNQLRLPRKSHTTP